MRRPRRWCSSGAPSEHDAPHRRAGARQGDGVEGRLAAPRADRVRGCGSGSARSTPCRWSGRTRSDRRADPHGALAVTNDRNRDIAYLSLTRRFGAWRRCATRRWSSSRRRSAGGGISKVKSARIQAILEAIGDPLSLDHLAELPLREAQDELCALPGVGRKTAACVLLFAFNMQDIPVDTHVSRVGTRLGLSSARARRSRSCTRCSSSRARRRRLGAAREPAAPRTAHLRRAAPGLRLLRPAVALPAHRGRLTDASPAAPGHGRVGGRPFDIFTTVWLCSGTVVLRTRRADELSRAPRTRGGHP